jgi:hypothetical protein
MVGEVAHAANSRKQAKVKYFMIKTRVSVLCTIVVNP